MPINYKDYPENWKEISKSVIEKAGHRCELCYAPNRKEVYRSTKWNYPWIPFIPFFKDLNLKKTKIVLTVHHIDGDKTNNTKYNLIAICQRCHLRLDLGRHIKNRKQNI